jgi:hypothetical protein
MRGVIIGVWPETWREIWSKLARHPEYGEDLFPDLYRELVPEPRAPKAPPPPGELTAEGELIQPEDIAARDAYVEAFERYEGQRARYEEAVSGGDVSKSAFRAALKEQIKCEADAVMALERAFNVVVGYGNEAFRNRYFLSVDSFLHKYNLRYDLRRPFTLHPTLPGVFANLVEEMKAYTMRDAHLHQLMQDFEEALRDLRDNPTPARMKTCMQKKFNLIEGIGQRCPGVTAATLGDICAQVRFWPHATLKEAVKKLYGFRSNYPGLGHAGNPQSVLREIEMRDLVAVSVVLTGFSPYLTDQINSDTVYGGG